MRIASPRCARLIGGVLFGEDLDPVEEEESLDAIRVVGDVFSEIKLDGVASVAAAEADVAAVILGLEEVFASLAIEDIAAGATDQGVVAAGPGEAIVATFAIGLLMAHLQEHGRPERQITFASLANIPPAK